MCFTKVPTNLTRHQLVSLNLSVELAQNGVSCEFVQFLSLLTAFSPTQTPLLVPIAPRMASQMPSPDHLARRFGAYTKFATGECAQSIQLQPTCWWRTGVKTQFDSRSGGGWLVGDDAQAIHRRLSWTASVRAVFLSCHKTRGDCVLVIRMLCLFFRWRSLDPSSSCIFPLKLYGRLARSDCIQEWMHCFG